MSLATRCTSCGTIFRVVQDQLKVSDGWVRCGRCEEVFNSLQSLFDLDREAPPPWPPSPANESEWHSTYSHQWSGNSPEGVAPVDLKDAEPASVDMASSEAGPAAHQDRPHARPLLRAASDDAPAWHLEEGVESPGSHPEGSDDVLAVRPRYARQALPEMDAEAAFAPTATRVLKELPPFVRAPKALTQAQSRPFVAAGWLAVLVLSALALVWQLAVHFQASVAARSPAIGDAIAAICRAAGCRLDLPLRLESVAVDSSGLTKAEGNGLYRLSVVLHNRGDTEVRVPAIDLSLTDDQGRVLGRKVLLPSELGSTRQGISPGTDLMLQGVLETGDIPAAGYTVEIFYP